MEKKLNIRFACNSFILYQNEVYKNYSHLYITHKYDIRSLISNQEEIEKLMKLGYYYWCENVKRSPSQELLSYEYEKMIQQEKEDGYFLNYRYDISFYKDINIDNIQSFYDFCLEVEVHGMRMKFDTSQAYADVIYIRVPWREEEIGLKQKMYELFGEPKVAPEDKHEKYGGIPTYIVPISKINKIIGIKKYRDKTYIEDSSDKYYIGKEEEIILDLHHFNSDVFQLFETHDMLEEYVDNDYKYRIQYEK